MIGAVASKGVCRRVIQSSSLQKRARRLAWGVATRLVSGTAVACPICQHRLRFFLPFGVGGRWRANALCPGCQSLERDRLAWLLLRLSPDLLAPGTHLLHVAPEACFEPRLRELLGSSYVTADLLRADVDRKLSVEQLPFEDQSLDAVICNHVLEHVADDAKAMREILRVLRPRGWALLQVPLSEARVSTIEDPSVTSPEERRRRFGQHDHVRAYGRDYPTRLRDAGFLLESTKVRDVYDRRQIRHYGLDAGETLHFCRRP
jgi:SAM-dependent methyltransferase